MKYLLGEKLHFDWKVVTITILSTLLLMVDYYHRIDSRQILGPGDPVSHHPVAGHRSRLS